MAKVTPFNMSRILKMIGYRTGQGRKITYYRPPIYTRDGYGTETDTIDTNELLLPGVQSYIRLKIGKDYQLERGGHNIVGSAKIYLPRLDTLKNFPNFTSGNVAFNEIEGWDKLIDVERVVYQVPTSGTTGWASGSADVTFASDGESLTATLGTDISGTLHYTTPARNVLDADRISFQISGSGSIKLHDFKPYLNATSANNEVTYANTKFTIPSSDWITVDAPFLSGTTSSSIYVSGTRYGVTVSTGSSLDYNNNLRRFEFTVSGATGDKMRVRNINFYRSTEWSVHRVNDYTDSYMCFDCVRIRGKRGSRKRAYGVSY